jgi:hypothetical protein
VSWEREGLARNVMSVSDTLNIVCSNHNESFTYQIVQKYVTLFETLKSSFIKIRPQGAELFHADGRTDGHDEANSRFSQFCEDA